MSSSHPTSNDGQPAPAGNDEGGLRAPPGLSGWRKAWWWFDFIILVKLARLRFIAILVVIGVVITQWDLLAQYYDKWTRPDTAAETGSGEFEWFCPMHPSIVRDNGKEKCPICFMPLSKRKKGDTHEDPLPPGVVNRVQLSPYRVALAGVRTWKTDYQPLVKEITTVGYVEFNEGGLRTVSARVKGRLDTLIANETGRIVTTDDVLASIYSPDLLVSVQNLLLAKKTNDESMLRSARTRLELLGISDDQIDEILATGESNTHLKIRSPITGHIIRKYVREGQYVDEGTPLYDIADLSNVWIEAEIYEDDLAYLPALHDQVHSSGHSAEPGGPQQHGDGELTEQGTTEPSDHTPQNIFITATTRAYPTEEFHGHISLVFPHADPETRTVRVRFEVDNPEYKLRPGMTANVKLKVFPHEIPVLSHAATADPELIDPQKLRQGSVLAVPESAVIDTGNQTIVYRQTIPGVFEGVSVTLGPRMTGPGETPFFPILSGLAQGDQVVTAGSFLVDAETRLNPAVGSIYFGGSGTNSDSSTLGTVRPSTPEDSDTKIVAALARLSDEDRKLAEAQRYCAVLTDNRLGTMGVPVKIVIDDQPVFLCCEGCRAKAFAHPEETLAKALELRSPPQ